MLVLVRTWVPSIHAAAVGNPASQRNSPSAGRLVVASVAVPILHPSEQCVGHTVDGSGSG